MKKSSVKGMIFRVVVLVLCVLWIFFCTDNYFEEKNNLPMVYNMNEIDLTKTAISGSMVYIDEAYVLERYVGVSSTTYSDPDGVDDVRYYFNSTRNYPTSDSEYINGSQMHFERYIVMFYDSTGTTFVTSLENSTNDISVLLGDAGGKPVKISLYAKVNGEPVSPTAYEKYRSEVNELKEKSLVQKAKENNAQIADFVLSEEKYTTVELSYFCETQEEFEEYYQLDSAMGVLFGSLPAAIVAMVISFDILKRLRRRNSENID